MGNRQKRVHPVRLAVTGQRQREQEHPGTDEHRLDPDERGQRGNEGERQKLSDVGVDVDGSGNPRIASLADGDPSLLEAQVAVPIHLIGVGPARDQYVQVGG